jgi:NADH oxidase (H2O2-forming)
MSRIVILGLGTAGFAAILAAKKTDRTAEITVIDDKPYDLMHPCGLPYAVEGVIDTFDKLKHPLNLERMNVDHRHPWRVAAIDPEKQLVTAAPVSGGEPENIPYGKLLVCTGARPFTPPIPGLESAMGRGAFTVSTPEDACALQAAAQPGMHAVCLGAGAIGLETAVALRRKGLDVTVVEMLPHVMPRALDADMSALLKEHLESLGVRVLCGQGIEEVLGGDNALDAVRIQGEEYPCDLLVVAAGVRANLEAAAAAGVATGKTGILINDRLETSIPNIYAAGDCVQTRSLIDGRDFTLQLSTTAYRQGTVAGTNAAGGNAAYPGVTGAFVSKIGDLQVAAVGYTLEFAKAMGYDPLFGKIKDTTLYDWYPGGQPLSVKVIADKATGKVLGAQAVGESGAASRVNVVSTALSVGLDLAALSGLEFAYCPAVSQAYDPLTKAVDLALRKMR